MVFRYIPEAGRTWVDTGDLVNWLLDKNEKIAREFEEKAEEVKEDCKNYLANKSL